MGLREKCEIKKASVHAGLRAKTLYESQMLSSQGRYNHFDTTPYELALVLYQQARAKSRGFLRKSGECFLGHGKSGKSFVFLQQKRLVQAANFLWKNVRNFRCKFPFSVL